MFDLLCTWSIGIGTAISAAGALYVVWGWLAGGVQRLTEGGEFVFEIAAEAAVRTLAVLCGISLPIAACLGLYKLGAAIQHLFA